MKSDKAASRDVAEAAVRAAAQSKDNPADLINVAIEHLVRRRLELPGYSMLDRMVARVRAEVNAGVFRTVSSRIPADGRARLARLLVADPATRRSPFDRLKDPARAATIGKLKARLKHLADLDAVGSTEAWLAGLPMAKVGHFAGEARLTDAADMKKPGEAGEARRLTLLAAMVHTRRVSARDEVTDMFCKRMAIIHRKGRERLEELREAHRAESERLLEVFGDVLAAAREATAADEDDQEGPAADPRTENNAGGEPEDDGEQAARRAGVLVLKALEAGGLEKLSAAHEAMAAHHGNNYLPLLERYYKSHRPVLFTLVDALDLQAASAERGVLDAVEFIRANRDRRGEWIEESATCLRDGRQVTIAIDIDSFASEQWRKTLRDKRRPGLLARRHLEVCVLSHLAAELRSGDIAVAGSDSYANLHDQLMSWEECQPHVAEFCEQAGIPASARGLVAHFRARLEKTAGAVDAGYPANADLRLEGGRPVLARRKGAERRPSALTLEARILDRLPERGLLDILARTAHLAGWHRHFGPPSRSDPKSRLPAGPAAVQRPGDPARLGARRYARPVLAGLRTCGAARVRAPPADPQLARPELLPPRPAGPLQAHRLAVRRRRHRLGPAGKALARPAAHRDLDPAGPAVLGDAAAPARQPLPAQPTVQGAAGTRPGCQDRDAASLPVRAGTAGAHHRGHQPDRVVPQLRDLADDRRAAHRPQRPRLPGEGREVQRAGRQRRHLLDRADITDAANALAAEGHPVNPDDLATITLYITRTIRRFGDWILDLKPPDSSPATRLDLQPRVLFPASVA